MELFFIEFASWNKLISESVKFVHINFNVFGTLESPLAGLANQLALVEHIKEILRLLYLWHY
jgi:hypothetical protein